MSADPEVSVVADSISPHGDRLTSVLVKMHRFPLAEVNTHRVLSRNSASSRAIPVDVQLQRFIEDPWYPLEWPREQPGMQGGTFLADDDLVAAQRLMHDVHAWTSSLITQYLREHPEKPTRLHKSLINRLMEWGQSHTVLLSGTTWEGFFDQRCSPLAQPEFRIPAEMIYDAMQESRPVELTPDQFHTPFILPDEEFPDEMTKCMVSSARCARTSYMTHAGIRDVAEDVAMFGRLATADPMHASPLEHVARPSLTNDAYATIEDFDGNVTGSVRVPLLGNFLGYRQFRHMITGSR